MRVPGKPEGCRVRTHGNAEKGNIMFNIFMTAVDAVIPIVALIALGYVLRRIKFINKNFVSVGNKFVFDVCLPCMLFINIYNIDDLSQINWGLVVFSVAAIFVLFGLGYVVTILTTKNSRRRGPLFQCTFLSNFAIIGISLAEALAGTDPANVQTVNGVVAMIQAFTVPLFNILAVISLSVFRSGREREGERQLPADENGMAVLPERQPSVLRRIVLNIVKNPMIIGIVAGLVFLGLRAAEGAVFGEVTFTVKEDLSFIYIILDDLRVIATPLALVVLGGQFEFSAVRGMTKEIIVGTVFRVVIAPVLCVGVAVLLGTYTDLVSFGQTEYPALITLFGTPVAVSSAIMAESIGDNDEQLAGQLVVWTSVASVFSLFAMVFALMSMGLLYV